MKRIAAVFIFVSAVLSGCGEPTHKTVSGAYVDKDGSTLVFVGNRVKALGVVPRETSFTQVGDTVTYKFAGGYSVQATVSGDSLITNYGYVYKKVD
jgi:hypothetical protein